MTVIEVKKLWRVVEKDYRIEGQDMLIPMDNKRNWRHRIWRDKKTNKPFIVLGERRLYYEGR